MVNVVAFFNVIFLSNGSNRDLYSLLLDEYRNRRISPVFYEHFKMDKNKEFKDPVEEYDPCHRGQIKGRYFIRTFSLREFAQYLESHGHYLDKYLKIQKCECGCSAMSRLWCGCRQRKVKLSKHS